MDLKMNLEDSFVGKKINDAKWKAEDKKVADAIAVLKEYPEVLNRRISKLKIGGSGDKGFFSLQDMVDNIDKAQSCIQKVAMEYDSKLVKIKEVDKDIKLPKKDEAVDLEKETL